MALSCLAGANPLSTSRTSCPGSTVTSGLGSLKEGAESSAERQTPTIGNADVNSPPQPITPNGSGTPIMSAPSPVGSSPASVGSANSASQQQQQQQQLFQQQQQQQAAMAAAGLFRLGSAAAGFPGAGIVPPHHLPSLMASLQAVAGVPLHHPAAAGLGGVLMGPGALPFNFPPMSAQHQNALLNWSAKLAQAAALGVAVHHHHHGDVGGLGSILAPGGHHHHLHQQQHSPDSSSSGRNSNNKKSKGSGNLGYTAGLIVKEASGGVGVVGNNKKAAKTVKAQVARRNAKNKALLMDSLETSTDNGKLIIEPPMVSPVGTNSPPSINGSSGGSSGHHNKSGSSRSSSVLMTGTTDVSKGSGDVSVNGGKVFSCSICQRTFGYKHVLQNHERTHTGEKPFECKQCGKRFTRDHHLKTHMRLHTGEKPYNCTHCDRQFVQVANLRRHLRVHTGERPYACELCTSRFSDSNQLKAHMLIHKGEKPFQCQLCSGKFRRRHHLMHHKCPKDPSKHLGHKILVGHHTEDDVESEPPPTPSSYASPPDEEEEDDELMDDMLMGDVDDDEDEDGDLSAATRKAPRERKPRETRRVIRQPAPPEQTEPEDLSTSKSANGQSPANRIRHASTFSVGSTGGWSAAGSVSIGLSTDEEPEDDDDLSDTEEIIQRASKKRRPAIDDVLRQTHQV